MAIKLFLSMSLIIILSAQNKAFAVESLSAQELASHCKLYADDPTSIDAVFCVRYIQGFIDGAIATDERVIENVTAEYESEESFSERAMRTRIKTRISSHSPTYYAEFCIGGPTPLKEVVEKVIVELSDLTILNKYADARNVVYQTLQDEYTCKEE